jgi:hypothetical protein
MKLSLPALFLAIACSCGFVARAATAAEFATYFAADVTDRFDYEALGVTSQPSPSDSPLRDPNDIDILDSTAGCGIETNFCCDPCWTIRAGAVILKRSSPGAFPIFSSVGSGATLVDAANYRFDSRGGIDLGAIRCLNNDWDLDFRYFAVDSWTSAQSTAIDPAGSVLHTAPPVFFFTFNNANSVYGSNLYSTEFNFRRKRGWLNTYIGYRYVELNEDLNFLVNGSVPAVYNESADNRLHGLQIGADANIWNNGRRLRLDSWLKAGMYYDYILHRGQIEFPPGTPFFNSVSQRDNSTAFLGDIGLVGVYQITDTIALRGGYQLLWLDGVALASDQIQTTNLLTASGADIHGDVFFHGALVGLEAQW